MKINNARDNPQNRGIESLFTDPIAFRRSKNEQDFTHGGDYPVSSDLDLPAEQDGPEWVVVRNIVTRSRGIVIVVVLVETTRRPSMI